MSPASTWSKLAATEPTQLSSPEIRVSRNGAGVIAKSYSAKVKNQAGIIYTSVNGDLDEYLNDGQKNQLELVVDALFTKASNEMIP